MFLNDKGSPSAAMPPHLSEFVCMCVPLSPQQCGWNRNYTRVGGKAEKEGASGEAGRGRDDRAGGGGGGVEREREGKGKGNLATVTFCSGLDIWIPSSFAASLLCVRTHSTADDNVCRGKVSYAVLRITYLFLHGAANFERGFWNGHWTSELTSCVWTFVCVCTRGN